jgi:cell division transport system ATP-binding protein
MIIFNQVTKRYQGGFEALSQINFRMEKNEMVFLTGHSGAGKSTFLKLLAMLEMPSAGEIIVDEQPLNLLKKDQVAHYRSQLGITFQTPHLLSHMSVFDNVALPLVIRGEPHSVVTKRVHASLDMVGLLPKQKMLPPHLSCGEQQRVGIARAMVHKPSILLADEPTGNLDPELSTEVMSVFSQLNQVGVAVLVATHDLPLIASMRHRMIMLKGGRIC